jgi:phosphoglycerate dehydrogenase-like enzyme
MNLSPIVLLHTDDPQPALETVQRAHPDLSIHTCDSYQGLARALQQSRTEVVYSVRFDGTPGYPASELRSAEHVKWIAVGGSGTDHLAPWDAASLTVTNAAGVAADMMAEYVLGCVLSLQLDLRGFHRAQQQRRWVAGSVTPIAGKSALLIGLGQTGTAVARRFKAMDMTVLGVRANPAPMDNVDAVFGQDALRELLPQADVIVVAVPLLANTRHLLASNEFAMMKSTAMLVDISRGGVVHEPSLLHALQSGKLAAAALDVFAIEPLPQAHDFWSMDNVIITPHCSSVYPGWAQRSVEMFADNLHRYRRGQPLARVVDPDRGY